MAGLKGNTQALNIPVNKPELQRFLATVLFGLLLPLSMAPFDWWPLGILSIAGFAFLIASHGNTIRQRFFLSLGYGIGVYALGASWIYVSIHDYGQAGVALSLLLITPFIIFLAALLAIPFVIFGQALNKTSNNALSLGISMLLVFPSIWLLGEWFRGWILSGFPWLYLGYGHTDTWLSGWAPISGVLGVGWITAFCGGALALLLRCLFATPKPKNLWAPIIGLAASILFWLGGMQLQTVHWTQPSGKPLSIGLIQPAIPLSVKWDPYQLPAIFDQFRADSETLFHNDVVVWPESAIPRFQHEVTDYLNSIAAAANQTQTALITGVPTAEANSASNSTSSSTTNSFYARYYNSVIGLGLASGVYHKQRLVPFGEYVPLEQWLRGAIAFFDLPMSAFSPGPKHQPPITAQGATIATAICYEIAYPELVRQSATTANLLLTLSNDTWFGKSIGPKQHFQIARMRAIENEKPLIRTTNDGISALVTADGKVQATLPSYQRGLLEGTLEPRMGLTPFGKFGAYPILLLSFFITLVALFITRNNTAHDSNQ